MFLGGQLEVGQVVDFENEVLDSMMILSADTAPAWLPASILKSPKEPRPTQVFIDVDEQTYRSKDWGSEPSSLPLDKIAVLIESAVANGALYVLVDFSIDGSEEIQDGSRDEQLVGFISKMKIILSEIEKKPKSQQSHLLFVRTLRQPLAPKLVKAVRPSPLDALIKRYPNNVHAVAPNFLRSSDYVLRHWRLWESACYPKQGKFGDGQWVIVPSPQVMITSLKEKKPLPWPIVGPTPAITAPCAVDVEKSDISPKQDEGDRSVILDQAQSAQLADWYAGNWVWKAFGEETCYQQDSFTSENCGGVTPSPQLQDAATEKNEGTELANRIIFSRSDWVRKNAEAVRQHKDQNLMGALHFYRRSASLLLNSNSATEAWKNLKELDPNIAGFIAVIGASYDDSRDTHLTPLGEMSGSLVLVNAIDTMQTIGILQSPPPLEKLALAVLALVGFSAAFALLSALWATVLMLVLFALTMLPLSFWFLQHGIWLDFSAPITGMYLYEKWEFLQELLNRKLTAKGETKCN